MCHRDHLYSSDTVLWFSKEEYSFLYACAFSISKGGVLCSVIPAESTVHALCVVVCGRASLKVSALNTL